MDEGLTKFTYWDEIKKWTPSVIILALSGYLVVNRGEYTYFDTLDLVIHEAGHYFFMFFGKYIHALGGTLMQIIIPSILIYFFYRNSYRPGIQVFLFWLGQNFLSISVYVQDARARVLPLFGPPNAKHDWYYLLGEINALEFDQEIGYLFVALAVGIFIVAVILPRILTE